jgi:hypothetical protein
MYAVMYGDLSVTNRSSVTHSTVIIAHPTHTACQQQSAAAEHCQKAFSLRTAQASTQAGFPFQGAVPGKHLHFCVMADARAHRPRHMQKILLIDGSWNQKQQHTLSPPAYSHTHMTGQQTAMMPVLQLIWQWACCTQRNNNC